MKRPPCRNKLGSLPTPTNLDDQSEEYTERMERAITPKGIELETSLREQTAELLATNARLTAEIEERDQIEKELRKSDERYRALIETVPDVVYGIDAATGTLTFLNLEFEAVTGWTREEWIGKPFRKLVHPEDLPLAMETLQQSLSGSVPGRYELRILCKEGHYATGEFMSIPQMHDGKIVGELGVVRDVTERKRTENALRKSERIQKALLDGICDPAWMKSKEGIFLAVNRAWCLFCDKEEAEIIGKPDSEVFSAELVEGFRHYELAVIKSGTPCRHEESLPGNQGITWFDTVITPVFDEQGKATGTIGIARNITERKVMEEKFLRTQRMESIGSLAGGIAHDLNNILGPIMMSASILREEMSQETRNEIVASIQESAKRGADIVKQVLTFARGAKGEFTVLDPRDLIAHVEKILKETLPKSITLASSLPDGLWNIAGDVTQLQQVLVNLCVNARDAMPQGGTLTLKAENHEVSKHAVARISGGKPGFYVRIRVADSGLGMSQEIINQIFDPFFTTKEVGKGTGLGLSTAMGIIKSHGGFITVDSKIGKGSKFSLYLPATDKIHPAVTEQSQRGTCDGNGELVLVVDDEFSICKMVETILKKRGYKALTARSAKEGLASYVKHRPNIKAVLTDLAMPCMDGVALIRKLREIDPSATVIASTGQSTELWQKELSDLGVGSFLAKPYNADQLLEVVHSALSEHSSC